MSKLLDIKERIKTLRDIRAVVRTLATVSAAKLASTRRRAAGLREYMARMQDVLFDQQAYLEQQGVDIGDLSALLREDVPVRQVAVLLITADRGMCGSYNLAACRIAGDFCQERQQAGQRVSFLLKGARGDRWAHRRGVDVLYRAAWRRGGLEADEVEQLLAVMIDGFRAGRFQEVDAVYTQFYSPLHRVPRIARLLPIVRPRAATPRADRIDKWAYEPSFHEVFDELLALYLRMQLWDVLLESYASEHGSRMITMEEAAERADKALAESQSRYHRLRREAITIDLLGVLCASRVTAAPSRVARTEGASP